MATAASFDDSYRETFALIAEHGDEVVETPPLVVYARERYGEVIDEIRPLLLHHWAELARNKDAIKLDPDYEQYLGAEALGKLWIFTARYDERLIGYTIFVTARHAHYRDALWAYNDIFWLAPEHRRRQVGAQLFTVAEAALRTAGVDVIHVTSKTAHPAAGKLLEHLGYDLIEIGHAKLLRGA